MFLQLSGIVALYQYIGNNRHFIVNFFQMMYYYSSKTDLQEEL